MKQIPQSARNPHAIKTIVCCHSSGTKTNTIAHAATHSNSGTMRGSSYRAGRSTRSIHDRFPGDSITGQYPQLVSGSTSRLGANNESGNRTGTKRHWSEPSWGREMYAGRRKRPWYHRRRSSVRWPRRGLGPPGGSRNASDGKLDIGGKAQDDRTGGERTRSHSPSEIDGEAEINGDDGTTPRRG